MRGNTTVSALHKTITGIGMILISGCASLPMSPALAESSMSSTSSNSAESDSRELLSRADAWAGFFSTVSNDSDVAYYEHTLGVKFLAKPAELHPEGDSYINYYTDGTRDVYIEWTHQWGVHGQRIFFEVNLGSAVLAASRAGRPCLTLSDFRDIALSNGWSRPEMHADDFRHGFKAYKANLKLSVYADGGLGMHDPAIDTTARLEQFNKLTACANTVYVQTNV